MKHLITAISISFPLISHAQVNVTNEDINDSIQVQELNVVARKPGRMILRGAENSELIANTELFRAACCNLGESFTTNPSVDVNYSDAATGAQQIKLLGLAGTYVQMLTDNIPNFRGAASPYALGYVPGTWMQSIQVSKGASSVKHGYESITGQINTSLEQHEEEDMVTANMYGNTHTKFEANAVSALHIGKRWNTSILAHYEDQYSNHDENKDGFQDLPRIRQYHLMNRWRYMSDHYIMHAGISGLKEKRMSGQTSHHGALTPNPYQITINTDRLQAYAKNAFILNHEHNSNVALIFQGTLHDFDATYGNKRYSVNERDFYSCLMFETDFTKQHNLSAGFSFQHDYFGHESITNTHAPSQNLIGLLDPYAHQSESTTGAYAQYTYTLDTRLTAMAGIRIDHSNLHGTFVTPRMHVKWAPTDWLSMRISAGKGYRTTHALAENNYLLASSRSINIGNLKQEEAWNYGASAAFNIPIVNKYLKINAEYYFTDFINQTVIDLDTDAHSALFYNLDGKSRTHVFQVDATYPFFSGFTLTAAYRYTDAKTTYGNRFMERPLTNRYKGLLTASYKTPLDHWQFDVTLQLNGSGRMPTPYKDIIKDSYSWDEKYHAYEQLSAQITRNFKHFSIYVGGENLTGFHQRNPIIDASNPWGQNFDATMIWAPVHGALGYAGIRIAL